MLSLEMIHKHHSNVTDSLAEHRSFFDESARRFADHFLAQAQDYQLDFSTLDEELDNLRRALVSYRRLQAWLDMARLTQAVGLFLGTRGYWAEHRFWLEEALNHRETLEDLTIQIEILEDLATITSSEGDRSRATAFYQEMIQLAEQKKDKMLLARAYYGLGAVYSSVGQLDLARSWWEKALSQAERASDEVSTAVIRYFLGTLSLLAAEGMSEKMNSAMGLTARIASRLGLTGKLILAQFHGMTYFVRGQLNQARPHYLEALELAREEGDKQGTALILYQLGQIAHREDDLSAALDYYQQSEVIAREIGDRTGLMAICAATGRLYLQQQRFDLALPCLEEGVDLERSSGDLKNVAENLYWLGYAVVNMGDPERARRIWEEGLAIFTRLGSPETRKVKDVLLRLDEAVSRKRRDVPFQK